MTENNLVSGDIRKAILKFTGPALVSMIFSELYNITNSMIVGNYVSLKALSAVSACTWICAVFNYAFFGLGMGAGIIVARYYGAKDRHNLKRSLDTAVIFALVGGLGLTVLSELLLPALIRLCNIGPDIYDDAMAYMRIFLLGNAAVLTSQICFSILKSFGDTIHQLYYSIFSSIINIILGLLFVRVLHMDVAGTATATIIAQFVTDFLAIRLLKRYEGINLDFHNMDFSFAVILEICALGIPAGFQNMLIAVSSMMVQSYVNRFPNEVIAGIGVAEKIASWAQFASVSVSGATMAMVAQNLGAGNLERARETVRESTLISTVMTVISIVIVVIPAPFLVSRFNSDPEVIRYGTEMIRWSVYSMLFINLSHIYNAACRGGGNVRVPMYIAIFGQCICKYAFVALGMKLFNDVRVLYLGTAFGYTVAGLLAALYFHKGKWSLDKGLRTK